MLSNKAVTCQRCLNSVLIVSLSLFLSICPPLWTSISSSDTLSAGKHVFYSNTVRRGLTQSECGFSGKITILFQQMIQQISGFCPTSCVMNYNVKNWNRNAITVLCLTWEIRIRAADSQKLSASVYIPWNAGRLLQRFEMSPQRLFVQTEKTTLSMYIILQAGARSGAADAFHKSLCASIRLKTSRQLLPPPREASRLGGGHFLRIVSHFSGGFCLGCEL